MTTLSVLPTIAPFITYTLDQHKSPFFMIEIDSSLYYLYHETVKYFARTSKQGSFNERDIMISMDYIPIPPQLLPCLAIPLVEL